VHKAFEEVPMAKQHLKQLLFRLGQKELLQQVDTLPDALCNTLVHEIEAFDGPKLEQAMSIAQKDKPPITTYFPLGNYKTIESVGKTDDAFKLLQSNKVATIILAGGEASRFGYKSPKGTYPLSIIKQKSLFALIAEKALACKNMCGAHPYIAIMTSETTHEETLQFFSEHNNFSLDPDHLDFFIQQSLPTTDTQGNFLYNDQGKLLTAPDGNGSFFWPLQASSILDKYKALGIEYVTIMLIDNALADPFSLSMLQAHTMHEADVTCGAVLRSDPEEKVGVFIKKEKGIGVLEYSEMPQADFESQDFKERFQYPLANISYFVMSLPFLEMLSCMPVEAMPLHKAKKRLTETQKRFLCDTSCFELFKYEYFIFDLLEYAAKPQVLLLDRNEFFSPLKNLKGLDSVTTVQKALLKRDQMQYKKVTGQETAYDRLFELAMCFYYPTETMLQNWQGKPLPRAFYIDEKTMNEESQ